MAETYLLDGEYHGDLAEDNPFASHEHYTTLTIICEQAAIAAIEQMFDEVALSASSFERDKGAHWQMEVILPGKHKTIDLSSIEAIHSHSLAPLEMQDWVTENQKDFPPLEIGKFYVHGSHLSPKEGAINMEIDAGRAFGTGEHATTAGCLLAMQALEGSSFNKIVDIGCGTGILALAAKQLWPNAFVIGGDMDKPSVDTSIENAEKNGMAGLPFVTAAGTQHNDILKASPYDLVVANILAGPLMTLAPEMCEAMAEKGRMILSGLLIRQEDEVIAAYEAQGLKCIDKINRDEWSAITLGC